MPVDAVRNVLEYLPPETLITLRGTSTEMRYIVDSYVFKLVETGEFYDSEGTNLRDLRYPYEPSVASVILENWGHNAFTRSVAPLSVEEAAAKSTLRAQAFDISLTPDVSYHEDPQAFNEEFQSLLAYWADRLESGYASEDLESGLYSYFQGLIRTDRLVYAATNKTLPTGTPVSQVMKLLRNGQASWISPAEVYDPHFTPTPTDIDPRPPKEQFQSALAEYAAILEKGDPVAQAHEAALSAYFNALISARRLVDAATGDPLPNGTPVSQVMQLLRDGQARWIAPQT